MKDLMLNKFKSLKIADLISKVKEGDAESDEKLVLAGFQDAFWRCYKTIQRKNKIISELERRLENIQQYALDHVHEPYTEEQPRSDVRTACKGSFTENRSCNYDPNNPIDEKRATMYAFNQTSERYNEIYYKVKKELSECKDYPSLKGVVWVAGRPPYLVDKYNNEIDPSEFNFEGLQAHNDTDSLSVAIKDAASDVMKGLPENLTITNEESSKVVNRKELFNSIVDEAFERINLVTVFKRNHEHGAINWQDEFDKQMSEWHDTPNNYTAHYWLGLSKEDYEKIVANPERLIPILLNYLDK